MKSTCKSLLFLLVCIINLSTFAQVPSADYYKAVKSLNLSKLWVPGKTKAISGATINTEPLGFIGDSYQRFYIHYTSVTKDPSNPYRYLVKGKTKADNHICSFTGTITVAKAQLFKKSDNPKYKEGRVTCTVDIRENKLQKDAGRYQGTMITDWCLDKKGNLSYDSINAGSDGFTNNQCKATWTNYKTNKTLPCNWGDFRIPGTKDLDNGAGEFSVNAKYLKNGWENYMKSLHTNEPGNKEAVKEENRAWWK